MMTCGLQDDPTLTLSRFRTKLKNETEREIILRDSREFVYAMRKILIQPFHEDHQRTAIFFTL
ncbi:unnamed protein product [Spirodela intermedia]|uniref:Uncharacterized protein n=1 Tax=Spirodela intermedia TaxID=51605 RepID=A0A7I8JV36_SPIIN|nr:unnamed protein product [Spirodela intermedia]CAA6673601.1 unnamed protein product [Spirodela intermedia]